MEQGFRHQGALKTQVVKNSDEIENIKHLKKVVHSFIIICALSMSHLFAESNPIASKHRASLVPPQIPNVKNLDPSELIQLAQSEPALLIIDARSRSDRYKGFVYSSISLPDNETTCYTLSELVPSLAHPIVFHSTGDQCQRSFRSIKVAQQCGYRNLYWFRGGFKEWYRQGFTYPQE